MLLRTCKYHNVTLAANEAAYTPCFQAHSKIILTAFVLKFSKFKLDIIYIQKVHVFVKYYAPSGNKVWKSYF